MPKSIFMLLCLVFAQHLISAQNAWFNTGQDAELMVSGKNFDQTGGYLNHPNGLASDGTRLLVCDRFNNRILVWNTPPETWDAAPDLVLGQPDFSSNNPGTAKNQLNWVGNASVGSNGKLAVADTENDRILLWQQFPTHNAQPADVAISLPNVSNPNLGLAYAWPWGVWTDGNRLAAVATTGAAILFWNSFPASDDTPPDYVIKLPQFGTPRNISSDGSTYFFVGDHNAKVTGHPGTFFWNSYPTSANQPYDFYRDEWIKGEKLPTGQLVAGGIQSIYVWNSVPTSAGQHPNLSLQPGFYKNGDGVDVACAGGRIYVNNYNGNDVLVFNNVPSNAGQLPDFALASPGLQAQTLDSIYYVQNPVPVTDGTRLIVSSDFDRALYIWDKFPDYSGQPYDHKIPTSGNVQIWATTLHNNTLVTGGRNSLSVWTNAAQISAQPDYILAGSIGAASLDDIRGVALDDQFFYLATQSGKLYLWKGGVPINNTQNPTLNLSSSSGSTFGYLFSDGEYLCAARPEPPTGVDIYRVADLAAGITTPFKIINSGNVRLNQVSQAAVFEGALAIASRADHRVLLWKDPADWGKPDKVVVLGQPDANSYQAAIGINRLFMPNALLPRAKELWVGEFKFSSRILKFAYGASSAVAETALPSLSAQVFPNPVGAFFSINLEIPQQGFYRATLFDAQGRRVQDLFAEEISAQGEFRRTFHAGDLASGVYFLRLQGPGYQTTLRIVK